MEKGEVLGEPRPVRQLVSICPGWHRTAQPAAQAWPPGVQAPPSSCSISLRSSASSVGTWRRGESEVQCFRGKGNVHAFLFMFAFIFPENSAQGELAFPTGGCLLLFSASVPFLSVCLLSAPSSFEAVTDIVQGGCPLDRLLSWEQPAPCPRPSPVPRPPSPAASSSRSSAL